MRKNYDDEIFADPDPSEPIRMRLLMMNSMAI